MTMELYNKKEIKRVKLLSSCKMAKMSAKSNSAHAMFHTQDAIETDKRNE
jgi:hypothetical protein